MTAAPSTGPTTAALLANFASPPAAYRPAPFFVLNDEHEGTAGEARLTTMLEGYHRVGFGGAFIHPRPGLITEYLSPRWFELVRHTVRECARLGLVPYLYDENSYPSGVGGGHVPALAPEARTRHVSPVFGDQPGEIPHGALALYRWQGDRPGEAVGRDQVAAGEPWVAFVMGSMQPMPWHGETACPSLLHPRTAEVFVETTYAAYRRELGDLWGQVPAIFTDEPHLPAQGHGPWSLGLHLTPDLLGRFEQRRGYDLRRHLDGLFYDVGDYRRVRYDLYDLMHRLWLEHWALPLEAWCDDAGIALTGHYLEHDWPCPYATPGHVHLLAHMHWPGTDMLETFLLTGHDDHDIQNFHPAPDGQEPHGLMFLRQVHSVANQLGKERVIDECWGAGGHDSTPADWARIGRWLVVHGVNLLNPHLSFATIRGTRKADHPQTFSDHSPWFEHLGPLNDELSRLCWASNQGTTRQRVLVLDPLTTGYCLSRKADCLPPEATARWSPPASAGAPPAEGAFLRALASVAGLQRAFGGLAQALSDAQVDFDLGDEYVIEEHGRIAGDRLVVGAQTYELLVWPDGMTNLRSETAALLGDYLGGGGALVGVRPAAITVDGRPSDLLAAWERRFAERLGWFRSPAELVRAVTERVPPRLRLARAPAAGLAHQRRELPDAELLLVVNSSAEPLDAPAAVETGRARLYELDPVDGGCHDLGAGRDGAHLRAELRLGARAATVLVATDETLPTTARRPEIRVGETGTPLALTSARRTEDNVLVVDTCALALNDAASDPEAVYAANARLWRAHGLETNGWLGVIQFRDQLLAHNRTLPPESGGAVTYRFDAADGVDLAGLRLAVETPELWRVTVNGQAVEVAQGERWLDEHIRAAPVGAQLRPGENTVALEGRPFDVRREIDRIYLLGDIACRPAEPGFRLEAPTRLGLGSWRAQGLPFYDREVAYAFALPETGEAGVLHLDDGDWAGSVLLVDQGGERVARLWEPPYRVRLDPAQGRDVTLRVVGLPKNLLGPWHDPNRPRGRAWTGMWFGGEVPREPRPGERYDLLDLGLFEAPRWVTG